MSTTANEDTARTVLDHILQGRSIIVYAPHSVRLDLFTKMRALLDQYPAWTGSSSDVNIWVREIGRSDTVINGRCRAAFDINHVEVAQWDYLVATPEYLLRYDRSPDNTRLISDIFDKDDPYILLETADEAGE